MSLRWYNGSMGSGEISSKSRLVAFLLGMLMLCGICGAHRLYVGRWVTALIQFATGGLLGIWQVIDMARLLCGYFTDDEGRPVIR